MIPPPFEYVAPASVPEAIGLLGQSEGAKILAGGQSLIPLMRFRLAAPPLLIDINHIPGLESIREEDGWLKLGALTREAELDRSELIHRRYPLLADTCRQIADPLVRNLATVGGNLAHADPANDHPATMLAYRAKLVVQGPAGERIIDIDDFFIGPFESALGPGELLTEIRIPAPQPYSSGAYQKLERKVGDFATAAVAVQITMDPNGNCSYAGLALTNLGLTPIRAVQAEQALLGKPLEDAAIREAAALAAQAAEPQADHRGSLDYKRALVRTLTVRGLRLATERLKRGKS
jgi:carbon-monoxide dehydrogenase medium subunit